MEIYSHRVCRVVLLPFHKVLRTLEDDSGWYRCTICTNCHHNGNVLPISGLLLMLNALSSSSYHLLIGGSSTCLEGRLIASIDVFFSDWRPIVSGLENLSKEIIEMLMGEWIDSLSTK